MPLGWVLACGGDDGDAGRSGPAAGDGGSPKAEGSPQGRSGGPPGRRGEGRRGGPPAEGRNGQGWGGGAPGSADGRGVPVEVVKVVRRPIAQYFETQGTLEAENEVDLVARLAGPVVELVAEEGMKVRRGQLLARLDDREIAAQLAVAQVRLKEAEASYARVRTLHEKELVSRDAFDAALAAFKAARGDRERLDVQLQYTRITAPFDGQVVARYVRFAEHVPSGARLFRLSDFDPLLCPIQVPERELPRLREGQRAQLRVEAFGDRRFDARVLRISPVVTADSGTVKVTLETAGEGLLRPGMFATVELEMERREDVLVVPRSALALDSLTDMVFVAEDGAAVRRDLTLGFRNDDLMEVTAGLAEGERVVLVGQDGLSAGTPVEVLSERETPESTPVRANPSVAEGPGSPGAGPPGVASPGGRGAGERGPGGPGGGRGGFLRDLDLDDPEQVERVKARMRERGLSEAQIEERLERIRERRGGG
ncbi:MAG: efflux RND transporter periplasmic adaptor subunit [Acidobacteriota bacterium]